MPQLSSQIMRYIDEHLTEDLSIQALADHLYMNRSHMSRKFGTGGLFHTGIHDFKTVSLCQNAFKQGKVSPIPVSCPVFMITPTFIRTFKKYAQVSPGHYRVTNMEA